MAKKFLLVAGFPDSLIQFRGPLLDALHEKGYCVHVAAPGLRPGSAVRLELEKRGFLVHCIPLDRTGVNPLTDLTTLVRLSHLMLRIRPDFVLNYTIKPVIYGLLASKLVQIPRRFALITGLGYAFTGKANGLRGLVRYLVQGLYSSALTHADKVFFQNPDDEELFRELKILPMSVPSSVVNGSGVDISTFAVTPLPYNSLNFLLIARLLGDKGVREYAQAAQRIKILHPEVRFSLVGWIDENPDAIAKAELDQWIHEGTLEYLGRMSDVREAINACSVYVLPSYREGTPRTVLEAMSMGRAVITTDAPGCRETVINGHNGFLVSIKSVDSLVEAMQSFIDDPNLAAHMGALGRQIAEEKYDVHKVNCVILREMGIQ